jgi:ParB family chromosome partitioning protein
MNIELIPLSKLIACPKNVRRTGRNDGIEELAASIKAHGLLQNLQVRAGTGGKFEVVAGQRRLAALKLLAKAKDLPKSAEIPCHICAGEEATEISLAENIMRLPMHPADQYEAFKAVADQGKSPEEIAARFGCSAAIVRQRLKLASVSPKLIKAYREEEIELEQLMALAISDDHAAQEKLWFELAGWNRHPSNIRRMLTQAHVEANAPRAQFVGIEAYVAAGGHVLRDLFDDGHGGYLTDPVLLNLLVTRKLEGEAEAIRAEGWKWVEIMPEIDREALREFGRIYPERLPAGEEEQAEIDRLTVECEALLNEHEDDPSEEVCVQIGALSERIDTLSEGTERWEPEDIALCGSIVGISHGGRIVVERGLLHPEDAPAEGTSPRPKAGAVAKPKREDGLSDRLVEDLTAHRTAALRAILAVNPDVALAAVVHALALPLFYPRSGESCLELDLKNEGLERSATGFEDSTAARSLAEWQEVWEQKLPGRAEEFWDWLLVQDTATRLDLLAYCAGCSVNAVKKAQERADAERFIHADHLAAALDLDMAQWWQPTGASYLSRVSKAKMLEAVSEGVTKGAAENLAKLKKEALVTHAEERLAGTGWLPAILRRKLPEADAPEIAAAA